MDTVKEIGAERVQKLLTEGAQLIEVLPPGEYREQHLPGSMNLPLKTIDANTVSQLDMDRPVIVYCWDSI